MVYSSVRKRMTLDCWLVVWPMNLPVVSASSVVLTKGEQLILLQVLVSADQVSSVPTLLMGSDSEHVVPIFRWSISSPTEVWSSDSARALSCLCHPGTSGSIIPRNTLSEVERIICTCCSRIWDYGTQSFFWYDGLRICSFTGMAGLFVEF